MQNRSNCPIVFALDYFGDKWSLLILRDLLFLGRSSYKEFLESKEGISTNILANRLQELEKNRFITKEINPSDRKKFIYQATEKTRDLAPFFAEMIVWSAKYDVNSKVPKKIRNQLFSNIDEFKDMIINQRNSAQFQAFQKLFIQYM